MIIHEKQWGLLARGVCLKESGKERGINGVFLNVGCGVAASTDGAYLTVMCVEKNRSMLDAFAMVAGPEGCQGWLYAPEDWTGIFKGLQKRDYVKGVELEQDADGDLHLISVSKKDRTIKPIPGRFPDMTEIVRQKEGLRRVTFDGDLLVKALETRPVKAEGSDDPPFLLVSVGEPKEPTHITAQGGWNCVIMPHFGGPWNQSRGANSVAVVPAEESHEAVTESEAWLEDQLDKALGALSEMKERAGGLQDLLTEARQENADLAKELSDTATELSDTQRALEVETHLHTEDFAALENLREVNPERLREMVLALASPWWGRPPSPSVAEIMAKDCMQAVEDAKQLINGGLLK